MPIVVRTELGSGLPEARAFKHVEPADVADAIVEALQTGRVDVFVPRSVAPMIRMQSILPRRVVDAIVRLLKADGCSPVLITRPARRMRRGWSPHGRPRGPSTDPSRLGRVLRPASSRPSDTEVGVG